MQIPITNHSHHPLPAYQTEGAAGMDIIAYTEEDIELLPMQRVLVPTGLHIELPAGYEAQIRPRSGLALKQGVTCLNSPGTIDSDYRGEIKVILINLSEQKQVIKDGDRIAQLVIAPYTKATWTISSELTATARGNGGFGSTDIEQNITNLT